MKLQTSHGPAVAAVNVADVDLTEETISVGSVLDIEDVDFARQTLEVRDAGDLGFAWDLKLSTVILVDDKYVEFAREMAPTDDKVLDLTREIISIMYDEDVNFAQ